MTQDRSTLLIVLLGASMGQVLERIVIGRDWVLILSAAALLAAFVVVFAIPEKEQ